MKILSVNAGSSSLKFRLYEMPEENLLISGVFERIGIEGSVLKQEKDGVEGKHHIAGLDAVAIGEVCLVQMEGNLVAVLLPALCQAGDDVAIVVKLRQGIEQGVHHSLVGAAIDQGIEPLRGKNGLDPQCAVCLCCEAGCGQCQHHNDSQKH